MTVRIPVRDLADARLARYRDLKNPKGGLSTFIAETNGVIAAALDCGLKPVSALACDRVADGRDKALLGRFGAAPVFTADEETLSRLTGYPLTRGILAEFERPAQPTLEELLAKGRRVALLENVRDASNTGSLFRSAAALGVDAVLLDGGCCDPLHRKAVRTSMGGVFRMPWHQSACAAPALIRAANEAGFSTFALALKEGARPIGDAAKDFDGKAALVLGNEADGLTEGAVSACSGAVIIPMHSGMDSLNVSAAAAIAFYAFARGQ